MGAETRKKPVSASGYTFSLVGCHSSTPQENRVSLTFNFGVPFASCSRLALREVYQTPWFWQVETAEGAVAWIIPRHFTRRRSIVTVNMHSVCDCIGGRMLFWFRGASIGMASCQSALTDR